MPNLMIDDCFCDDKSAHMDCGVEMTKLIDRKSFDVLVK
jgi:hypothetical protein